MSKQKRKLTRAEKAKKKQRRKDYMTIFINGKQKRVKRPPTIDGMDVDEFIRRNADPIWLHQNEMWEYMEHETEDEEKFNIDEDLDIPFWSQNKGKCQQIAEEGPGKAVAFLSDIIFWISGFLNHRQCSFPGPLAQPLYGISKTLDEKQ